METKMCTKCKEYKDVNMFGIQKSHKSGLKSRCKVCRRIDAKKYRKENASQLIEYRKGNKQQSIEYRKKYRECNKEKLRQDHRKDYKDNKDLILKNHQRWKIENKDKVNIQSQNRRSRKISLPYTFTNEQWDSAKLYFQNFCCYCGKELPLTQDHFVAMSKGGGYTIDNIIPSCKGCNSSKHNSDFFLWFKGFKFYSKEREVKILEYLKSNGAS